MEQLHSIPVVGGLVLILAGGLVFLSTRILYFSPPRVHLPVAAVATGLPVRLVGEPARVKIPVINVDAAVEYVGLTPQGAMDAPKGPKDVAWYEPGPRPGEIGSAVMAGHYGWKNGEAAAFDNLHKLRAGDRITVEDGQGMITTFVVRELRRYDAGAQAAEVFGSTDGGVHLNLVTCEGVWNKNKQSYSKRLVVFTDKET